jgi:hypothetical protein
MSPQAGWTLQEEVVPRLRSAIPRCVHCVGAEDHEELVQDATAIAAIPTELQLTAAKIRAAQRGRLLSFEVCGLLNE